MHESMIRIERLLKARGMDWADFARLLDVQKQHINNWKNRGISKNKAIEAAQKLDTSVDIILCDEAHGSTVSEAFVVASDEPLVNLTQGVREPEGSYPGDLNKLIAMATPRSRSALEKIAEAAANGNLTDDDLTLLNLIAERFASKE